MATADDGMKVHFEGRTYPIEEFTLGELEWLEEHVGTRLDDNEAMQSMKAAVGVVYLIKRREDPTFTVEQARETPLAKLEGEPPQAEAGPKRPTRAAAKAK
jgi:hypothetical protein